MNDNAPEPPVPGKSDPVSQQVVQFKNNRDLLLYLFLLIRQNRKWWLLPFLFVLAFLGLFVSLTGNTSLLPAIYALF
jgi:hypothetical protein